MIAYKFLATGRQAPFSGARWPEPGTWLEVRGQPEHCLAGVHALRARELLGWIDDELWTCELGGEIEDDGDMLIAERGRLVERVQSWNELSAYDFARSCATRGRELVVEAIHDEGHHEEARELEPLDATSFATVAAGVAARLPTDAAGLLMMAADTTALAEGRDVVEREPHLRSHLEAVAASRCTYGAMAANVAFVIAASTAGLHPDGFETGFAAERAWQLDQLLPKLGLVALVST